MGRAWHSPREPGQGEDPNVPRGFAALDVTPQGRATRLVGGGHRGHRRDPLSIFLPTLEVSCAPEDAHESINPAHVPSNVCVNMFRGIGLVG